MPTRPPAAPRPARRRAVALVAVAAVVATLPGCGLLGHRRDVDRATAEQLLVRAVDLALSPQVGQLCGLSTGRQRDQATTCTDTLLDTRDLRPDEGPSVTCAVPVGDVGPLRGGMVLVVEGRDANGDPYTTEFVVYDDGSGIGVLDAVWWSGLSIRGYGPETVTWRFDSGSTLCEDRALPAL